MLDFANGRVANDSCLLGHFSYHGLWKTFIPALTGRILLFRVSYDLFLTNVIRILGKVECIDLPIYYRVSRADPAITLHYESDRLRAALS